MKTVQIQPSPQLRGTIQVPGDKSISHRALMLSALSEGKSTLKGLLMGQDVLATLRCFQAMGVPIDISKAGVVVEGVGLKGLQAPTQVLDCGNSGTTMRLMMGLLAAQPFTARLTGDASLNQRPMERILTPLKQMGAHIEEQRASPTERVIRIEGRPLTGITYELPMASAQVKSAVLLAGLYASGTTQVIEKIPSRDHTELMLLGKGLPLQIQSGKISLQAPLALQPEDLTIPGDISSAAFFLVGGAIGQDSEILLQGVGVNPTRTGILDVLKAMGAKIQTLNPRTAGGEAVADLRVESSELHATSIGGALIPRLIDEIPILSVAAGRAQGQTQIRDAAELRVKETDRIQAVVEELGKLSINIKPLEDGMDIQGASSFQGGDFQSHSDHRMAMSLAIAATQAQGSSQIQGVACVDTSYPKFWEHLGQIGVSVEFL